MFSIVFLITAIFTFEGMDQAYFTYHTDMAFLSEELCDKLKGDKTAVLMIDTYNTNGVAEQRKLFAELMNSRIRTPVIIGRAYGNLSKEQFLL